MVHEFRDINKLPPSLNRTNIFILLVKQLSPKVSLYDPLCCIVPWSQAIHSLCFPSFGTCSALDFFNILAFSRSKTSSLC